MKSLTKVIIGLGALAVFAGGCTVRARGGAYYDDNYQYYGYGQGYVEPQPVYVNVQPPQAYVEVRTAQPGYGYTWIDGYWHWSGSSWVWFRGRWEAPRTGYAWVGPTYQTTTTGGYNYVPGYWSNGPRVRTVDSYPNQPGYGGGYTAPPPSGGNGAYVPPNSDYQPPRGQVYTGGTVSGSGTVWTGNRGNVTPPPTGGTVYAPGTVVRPAPGTVYQGGTVGPNSGTIIRPAPGPNGTTTWGTGTVAPPPGGNGGTITPGRDTAIKPYPWKRPPMTTGTVTPGGTMTPGTVAPPPAQVVPGSPAKPVNKGKGKVKWNFGR